MVRWNRPAPILPRCSPHTRGDGPGITVWKNELMVFSPHAWGWSGHIGKHQNGTAVLPTRVGMVRNVGVTNITVPRSPHTRGDGPANATSGATGAEFSPHAWGWSDD